MNRLKYPMQPLSIGIKTVIELGSNKSVSGGSSDTQ
jgi:hypothetical protein